MGPLKTVGKNSEATLHCTGIGWHVGLGYCDTNYNYMKEIFKL